MIGLVVGALVAAAAMLAVGHYPVGVFYDDGLYLILAKALAGGEGYRFINLPGAPLGTHYPPGYPALLAVLWWLDPRFPHNLVLFKLVNAALLGGGALGAYALGRRRFALPRATAACAALAGALAMPVLAVTGVLFSEPLFLAILCVALLAVERVAEEERPRAQTTLAVGALCGLVVLVRTIGVAVPIAAGAMLVARRHRREAGLLTLGAALVAAPWIGWTMVHADAIPAVLRGSYGTYGAWLGDGVRDAGLTFPARVIAKNLADLPRPFAALFAGGAPTPLAWAIVAALATFAVLGLRRLLRTAPITASVLVSYEAIVVAWPYPPDRFLWGIWPLVMMLLAAGATEAFSSPGQRRRRAVAVPLIALAAGGIAATAGYVRYELRGVRGQWWATAQRQAADGILPLLAWVSSQTDPGAVVATDSDPLVYLYTGRRTVPTTGWSAADYLRQAPDDSVAASARALLHEFPVDYFLVAHSRGPAGRAAQSLVRQPGQRLAFRSPLPGGEGAVFTVLR